MSSPAGEEIQQLVGMCMCEGGEGVNEWVLQAPPAWRLITSHFKTLWLTVSFF